MTGCLPAFPQGPARAVLALLLHVRRSWSAWHRVQQQPTSPFKPIQLRRRSMHPKSEFKVAVGMA